MIFLLLLRLIHMMERSLLGFTDREDGEKKEECEVEIDSIDLSTRYVPNVET